MATKTAQGRDLDDVNVGAGDKRGRPSDKIDLFLFKEHEKKYIRMRLFGGIMSYGIHWVDTKTREGKKSSFSIPCSAYDTTSGTRDSTKRCAWCEHQANGGEHVRFSEEYFINGIIRSEQKKLGDEEIKPTRKERETGFKDKGSDTPTPVKGIRLATSVARSLKDLKQLNTIEDEDGNTVSKSLTDRRYGRDVSIMFDGSKPPAQQYAVQIGEKITPLKRSEREYLIWDLSGLHPEVSEAEALKEYKSWAQRMGILKGGKKKSKDEDDLDDDADVDNDDDDLDDDEPKRGKKKPAAKKAAKRSRDEDEDDDDLDEDEDEDEEEERPKKGKKVAAKKSRDEDEDDDDLDEDEDEEEERPAKRSKPAAKKAAKKRSRDEDEDEEDEDDDLDEDEEEERPKKKTKPLTKKAAKRSRDEDEEEDEDEDEDEEEERPVKKGKKVAAKKRSRDEDEDEEDEEEDERPKKGKKRRSKDDDDDFEDL